MEVDREENGRYFKLTVAWKWTFQFKLKNVLFSSIGPFTFWWQDLSPSWSLTLSRYDRPLWIWSIGISTWKWANFVFRIHVLNEFSNSVHCRKILSFTSRLRQFHFCKICLFLNVIIIFNRIETHFRSKFSKMRKIFKMQGL